MSIRVSQIVWDHAPYDAGSLLVLLALAEWADDSGLCWPHVESIARRARLGVRQTHNVLRQLKRDGVLLTERGGRPRHSLSISHLRRNPEVHFSESRFSEIGFSEICDRNPAVHFQKQCNSRHRNKEEPPGTVNRTVRRKERNL